MNKFQEGQEVICISDNFPLIKKYGGTGLEASYTPKKGEILVVDEVLGEFIRFDKYDTNESYNWWKDDRFVSTDGVKDLVDINGIPASKTVSKL